MNCYGYLRADGLWDIEGHLVDTKTYAFENKYRGKIAPGEPVHEMWLRLTIDDDLLIHAAEATTVHGPFRVCPDITPRFARLAGIRIGPGWMRKVSEQVGGTLGCTHLVELLRPMATTAYQTMAGRRRQASQAVGAPRNKPVFIDSCHALAASGPVVKEHWPEFYAGDESA